MSWGMMRGRKSYARLFWSLVPCWAVPWADPCEDPHPVVPVDGIDLDVGIAPLVMHLWQNGIHTHNSCQGDTSLYRLHELRHPAAWAPPSGNPYSAYLTLDCLESARAVVRILNPPTEHLATISARGSVSPEEWWFVHFDPGLLASWQAGGPGTGRADSSAVVARRASDEGFPYGYKGF